MLNGNTAALTIVDEIAPRANRAARRRQAAVDRLATSGAALDAFNERQIGRVLHPTKGWRKVNTKRTVASTIVSMAGQGFLGSNLDMQEAFANV